MSEWEKVEDDETDANVWINDQFGNIYQVGENNFVVLYPQIVKIGPFPTVETAQKYIEENYQEVRKHVEEFNHNYLDSVMSKKGE
jgi:hypothetical protein